MTRLFSPERHAAWELCSLSARAADEMVWAVLALEDAIADGDDDAIFAAHTAMLVAKATAKATQAAWLEMAAVARDEDRLPV